MGTTQQLGKKKSRFKRALKWIQSTASIYWWWIKNILRKGLNIIGRLITLPLHLCYGLFWVFMLLFKMGTIILSLSYHRASIPQWQLEIGRVFLIHGANLQVGQSVRFLNQRSGKTIKKWVANLHYDFRNNKINTTYSPKAIPGLSDRFIKKDEKKG